ncbi:glutamate/gamma-aminobutyrate family transporter YjeM [Levilactobacillus tujiorum]|nr:glutamate/gamma-aminobutyrate family transporter YjeM [Levilactobacillus tujiorum]
MAENSNKITLMALVMMIFTTVFGFANSTVAYFLMGYSSILFYLAAAVLFFIPFALMMAEYGAAIKSDEGSGMYQWMEVSVNPQFAFIGTFMWFASYIIWLVSTSAKVWIPFTTLFFGTDQTQKFAFAGLNATQVIGILSCLWMILVTYVSIKGVKGIVRVTSLGGLAVMSLNAILLVVSGVVLALRHGQVAQPLQHFMTSPHPNYQQPMGIMSFAVFAIFAYGGLEVLGGMVDKTKNPEKTFPKAIVISAIVITLGYAIGILCWGISTNWNAVLSDPSTNMGNISYVMMRNLGDVLGQSLGLSAATSTTIGLWFARYTGLGMFLAYSGAFFTLTYSPLKTLILGTPKSMWPKKFTELNENDMPSYAMKLQCTVVIVIILLASFASTDASAFYNILTLMANVSMTLPYLFLVYAFPKFKHNHDIQKPFEVYKSPKWTTIISWVVFIVVLGANTFTLIQPVLENDDLQSTMWMLVGPILFGLLGVVWYHVRQRKANRD